MAKRVETPVSWETVDTLHFGVEQAEIVPGEPRDYSFQELINIKDTAKLAREECERQEKAASDALLSFMLQAEVEKVALWDGWTFDKREGRGASKIDSTKLLEKGVPLATIQESTVEGKPYTYVQITKPKVK